MNDDIDHPSPHHPSDHDLAVLAAEAVRTTDWAALERLWSEHFQYRGFADLTEVAPLFAALPEESRRRYPVLTWARAVGIGQPALDGERQRVVTAAFLKDAVNLHSSWQTLPDVDAAVRAGTIWLASQQFKTGGGRGADDAWATRNAIAAHIERCRLAGEAPSDAAAAAFHAKSAQLALLRAEVELCVAEADHAIMLEAAGPSRQIALAVRAIALELQGTHELATSAPGSETVHTELPDGLGLLSLPAWLADAARAVRALDREASERALARLDEVDGEPLWPIKVVINAAAGAIWGDPEEALLRLHRDLARNALTSLEHHEPISRVYLARVRSLLLCRLSDPAAALAQVADVPHPWDWVPRTRALVWAGDLDGAVRTAREGLFVDPSTWQADRLHLSVLKAAALASRPEADPEERERAFWRAVTACTESRSITPLAFLPSFALTGLLDLHDQLCVDGCILCDPLTRQRLAELPEAGRGSDTLIRLTPREKELLPLLASPLAVPQIARNLHLSVGTVRKQVATLRTKFGAHSREELLRIAAASGHLTPNARTAGRATPTRPGGHG
ncbi:MAG: helix-turn-helix transcriptional regulator [Propionicimonas sp.]|nr:helix-turn-helix transcriptional regulator [Propionicimonas sp.]